MNRQLFRWGLVSIVIMATLLLLAILFKGLDSDPTRVSVGLHQPARAFTAGWLSGGASGAKEHGPTITLSEFKGKPVIVNFWASWCESCRSEAKEFESFYQAQQGAIALVGIAVQDTAEKAKSDAKLLGKTYLIGLDIDGHIALDYGVTGVPETFLIDKNGILVHKIVGPVTYQELDEAVKKYLGVTR